MIPFCSILPDADHSNCPSSIECVVVSIQDVENWNARNLSTANELAGIERIAPYGLESTIVVIFKNGSMCFSDHPELAEWGPVANPNLRVLDHDNWIYSVTQGF